MALSLSSFIPERTLSTDEVGKSICIAGYFQWDVDKKVAIVRLSMPVPREESLAKVQQGDCVFHNSIFAKFQAEITVANPIEVIYPATKSMYLKHLHSPIYLIPESPSLYSRFIRPYIEQLPAANTQWVRNILSGISEGENVKYRSEDFVIAVDYKLQTITKDYFYFLGLSSEKWGLKSLRDLRGEHLPLLKEMKAKGIQAASECVGATEHEVLSYVHYYPSFYHFHIHFTSLDGFQGNSLPRAHLTDSIISNLELDPNYYASTTLPTPVKTSDPIYPLLQPEFPSLPPSLPPIPEAVLPRLA